MLRLNTSIAPVAPADQKRLGALGGDNAGFPNGRRPGDDVVDIELRVAMGVLCHAFPGAFGCGAGGCAIGPAAVHRRRVRRCVVLRLDVPVPENAATRFAERHAGRRAERRAVVQRGGGANARRPPPVH